MTEDDGYQTIVPDMGAVKAEQADREAAADALQSARPILADEVRAGRMDEFPGVQAFARHRQASYSQALKDAAEVVGTRAADLKVSAVDWRRTVKAILSLGDKSNG